MFRFDLSLLSAAPTTCQSENDNQHHAVEEFVKKTNQISDIIAPSPARTAKTQTSSTTCSESNNNTTLDSIELGISQTSSSKNKHSWLAEAAPSFLEIFESIKTESMEESLPSKPTPGGIGRKPSSFSTMGKNASMALKNLRKNISLVTAMSFDSGTSSKRSRIMKKIKKARKSISKIPRDVSVKVLEGGQGVEITTKPSENDESYDQSIESNSCSSDCVKKYEMSIPNISRETSTSATRSLTSGEGTENTEIEEDEDMRKLYELMERIRTTSIVDNENIGSSFAYSSPSNSFDGSVEVEDEDFNATTSPEPCEDEDFNATTSPEPCQTPDCLDLMVFVNNEHRVLEYSTEEFQEFGSN